MNNQSKLFLAALMFMSQAGVAHAEPKNGFGLNAGMASHTMTPTAGVSRNSSGLSLGIDYQFALSPNFSINPFLQSSGETTDIANLAIGHGILGVQLRYWAGDMFFGGHVGSYSEVQTLQIGGLTLSTSARGGGAGLVAGWEPSDSGLYLMGQLDSATVRYTNADVKLSGVRLSAGYRWK